MLKIDGGRGENTIDFWDFSFLRQLCPLILTGEGQSKINGHTQGTSIENLSSGALQSILFLASKNKIEPQPQKPRFSMVTPWVPPLIFILGSNMKINGGFRSQQFSERRSFAVRLLTLRVVLRVHKCEKFPHPKIHRYWRVEDFPTQSPSIFVENKLRVHRFDGCPLPRSIDFCG